MNVFDHIANWTLVPQILVISTSWLPEAECRPPPLCDRQLPQPCVLIGFDQKRVSGWKSGPVILSLRVRTARRAVAPQIPGSTGALGRPAKDYGSMPESFCNERIRIIPEIAPSQAAINAFEY